MRFFLRADLLRSKINKLGVIKLYVEEGWILEHYLPAGMIYAAVLHQDVEEMTVFHSSVQPES